MDNPELLEPNIKVRMGMELWCGIEDPNIRNSNLQITWGRGNSFHLTALDSAACNGNDTRRQLHLHRQPRHLDAPYWRSQNAEATRGPKGRAATRRSGA